MSTPSPVIVRMFGSLYTLRKERGLDPAVEVHLPPEGCAACDLAKELDLPPEKIEGVFVNHQIYSLDHVIQPGDRVAFLSPGIPAPLASCRAFMAAGVLDEAPDDDLLS